MQLYPDYDYPGEFLRFGEDYDGSAVTVRSQQPDTSAVREWIDIPGGDDSQTYGQIKDQTL